MKKISYIALGIVLAGSLMSGCGEKDNGNTESSQADAGEIATTVESSQADVEEIVTTTESQDTSADGITLETVLNHEATDESAFQYAERENGIEIQGCTSQDEIIVVPETINGVKVTSVDDCAFEDIKSTVRGLYLSNNIETVDTYSLCNFEKLEVLILGESMSDIPRACIVNCPSLQYIKFMCPEIKNMEFGSVNGCEALKCIYFAGDVENIENNAFLVNNVTIYGKKDSNVQTYVEGISDFTFEAID